MKSLVRCLLLPTVLVLTASFVSAQPVNVQAPSLTANSLLESPVIDGDVLSDPVWQAQTGVTGFVQVRPQQGVPASQKTRVYVSYSEDTFYLAVICYDDDPKTLIISDARRDASLRNIDSFRFIIDGFQDRQNGFVFGTTPGGAQYDGQVTKEGSRDGGGGFNKNWDATWEVATKVGDFGWSAEFAIPFKSLRYSSAEVQDWGINFQRNIGRTDEVTYWSPLERQYNLFRVSQAGTLTGLRAPKQRNLKFTPYVLGQVATGGDAAPGTHDETAVGFDAKYSVTPSLTLDLTYNTDFAQVEVDEVQVNLDRFSIFLPEKRPFFLENAGQFSVGDRGDVELFFSRRIGIDEDGAPVPIDAGLRLSGKAGAATNLGLLHMTTGENEDGLGEASYSLARVSQEFGDRTSLGGLVINKDDELTGDVNRTYAIDGQLGVNEKVTLSGYIAKTDTPTLRGEDLAGLAKIVYSSESWTNQFAYSKVENNFNPEVGFLRRTNYEKISTSLFHRRRPKDFLGLFELRPHIFYRGYRDDEGFYESGFLHVDNHWEWHNGWEIHTGVNFTHEGVQDPFEINSGTFVGVGEYDHTESQMVLISDRRKPLSLSLTSRIGGFYGGDRNALEADIRYRFGDAFTSNLTWSRNDIDLPVNNGAFEVNVARLRMSYSFTPKVLLQVLVQYDDRSDLVASNVRFSWLQSANSGLYLVYNELDDETVVGHIEKRREFAIKYSRILDVF